MKKLLLLITFVPLAIILVVLSVANRHSVVFKLDPVDPVQPFFSISLPLFIFLFITLFSGLAIGSTLTWFSQSKYRKMAREKRREVIKWKHVAKEKEERIQQVVNQIDNIKSSTQTPKNPESLQKILTVSGGTG